MAGLKPDERLRIQRYFASALCLMQRIEIFWLPGKRSIAARSPASSKVRAIPAGARSVGEYEHPFKSSDFLGDLDDVLAKIRFDGATGA